MTVEHTAFAERLLDQLDSNGYTPRDLDRLIQWIAHAHDTRWIELRVTVDGTTGSPIHAIEAHTLELCVERDCRVDHVYHGAGRTLSAACADVLGKIGAR